MSEIQSVTPIFSVVADDGDYTICAVGAEGKRLAEPTLRLLAGVRKVTYIADGVLKVFKATGGGNKLAAPAAAPAPPAAAEPDIQDQFIESIEQRAGRAGLHGRASATGK